MLNLVALLSCIVCLEGTLSKPWIEHNIINIIDGKPVRAGELPFMVSLQKSGGTHICGGSIISDDIVMTAAHCMNYLPTKVVAGSTDLSDFLFKQERKIVQSSIKKHPLFRKGQALYDIAIFNVKNPFSYSFLVGPIVLEDIGGIGQYKNYGRVAGWGVTKEDDQTSVSRYLLAADLIILSHEVCLNEYGDDVDRGLICALPIHKNEDACQGDSGGPLLFDNKLIGIISSGAGCGSKVLPGLYTNVTYFHDWIVYNM